MSDGYQPEWWFHQLKTITPDDIRQMCAERIEAGEDKELVEAALRLAVREAGGTIEDLARRWTEDLDYARKMREFRAQLERARPRSRPQQPAEEKENLLRLIDKYPETALRTLAEMQRSQARSEPSPESDDT